MFQFQCGAIKTGLIAYLPPVVLKFQFQCGAIKTRTQGLKTGAGQVF